MLYLRAICRDVGHLASAEIVVELSAEEDLSDRRVLAEGGGPAAERARLDPDLLEKVPVRHLLSILVHKKARVVVEPSVYNLPQGTACEPSFVFGYTAACSARLHRFLVRLS